MHVCAVFYAADTLYCKTEARVNKEKEKKKSLRPTAGMQYRETFGFFQFLARFIKCTYSFILQVHVLNVVFLYSDSNSFYM